MIISVVLEVFVAPSFDQVLLNLLISLSSKGRTLALCSPLLKSFQVYRPIAFEQVPYLLINLLLLSFAPARWPAESFLVLSSIACGSHATMDIVCCLCSVE